mgnify:CR=1 FL=1
MTLEDDDPDTFTYFVHWLYYQHLPDKNKNDDKELTEKFYHDKYPGYEEIVRLCVFADKYETTGPRRATVDLLFHTMVNHEDSGLPGNDTITYAFKHLSATSPMRRLLVDLFCHYESLEGFDRHVLTNLVFLQAMWQRYVHSRCNEDQDIAEGLKLCDCHEHTNEGDRKACEKNRNGKGEGSG